MQAVKTERAESILKGALALSKGNKIATIGWCFVGGWSLQTGILPGNQAKACVMYYGMPEKYLERLSMLKTDVLGVFASKDKWINNEVVNQFKKDLNSLDI
jgi:carboxymethylenebutenolidase